MHDIISMIMNMKICQKKITWIHSIYYRNISIFISIYNYILYLNGKYHGLPGGRSKLMRDSTTYIPVEKSQNIISNL